MAKYGVRRVEEHRDYFDGDGSLYFIAELGEVHKRT